MANAEISVNIVNRDYPPYRGITGESAAELAEYLVGRGFRVNVIHAGSSFFGKGGAMPAGRVFKVKNLYNGNNRILRLLSNFLLGYLLIRRSKKIPCTLTIVMTDPSLLNMWASLMLKRQRWILWAMDLYPEAFAAWGLISGNSFLYSKFYRLTIKNAPEAIIALGPLQTNYLQRRYNNPDLNFLRLPCGIYSRDALPAVSAPQWAGDAGKVYLGYLGNLGAPHSLEFLCALADNLDTERFRLIFSVYGYGGRAQALVQYVSGRAGIEVVPAVQRAHLPYIDVHLASLLPQCAHISVPSKTVSSVCAGSAFLYYGSPDSDNWAMLQDAGWLIPFHSPLDSAIKTFFQTFDPAVLARKKECARRIAAGLNEEKRQTFEEIAAVCAGR